MAVNYAHGLAGAGSAAGIAVIVDTFRAFTTAAFAQAQGVGAHYLTATVSEARAIADQHHGALLCGEVDGIRPDGFDLGNSPAEILAADIRGRTLIQRTSAGTRCVLAALGSETTEVYAASLVVATATARAVGSGPSITIVASGRAATTPVYEDDATARLIGDLIGGHGEPPHVAEGIRDSESARSLAESSWAHPDDVHLATDVDRFDFALKCEVAKGGSARMTRFEIRA